MIHPSMRRKLLVAFLIAFSATSAPIVHVRMPENTRTPTEHQTIAPGAGALPAHSESIVRAKAASPVARDGALQATGTSSAQRALQQTDHQ